MDKKDLRGKRFGKLVAFSIIQGYESGKWLCRCDCGNEIRADGDALEAGKIQDCGCKKEKGTRL